MTEPSAEAYARAAFIWGQNSRLDQMRNCVNKLDREQVLNTMRACAELTAELAERYNDLARTAGGLEPALAPDSLPDNVDGFAIDGRTG